LPPLWRESRVTFGVARVPLVMARVPLVMARVPFVMARVPFVMARVPFVMARVPYPIVQATLDEICAQDLCRVRAHIFKFLSEFAACVHDVVASFLEQALTSVSPLATLVRGISRGKQSFHQSYKLRHAKMYLILHVRPEKNKIKP
jgi:hypothetical protein